ncbi:MAG: MFS transporter [Acidobacteriota bacterium]
MISHPSLVRLRGGLDGDFWKLWLGQSISAIGSQVTSVALPLTAVLVLDASSTQMGWLVAAEHLPMALFGLFAGVHVDRVRRRPILVVGELGRGVLLITIPVAAWLDALSFLQLLAVAFSTGSLYVFSAVASVSYLPSLLGKEQLLAANSRLWFSRSFASVSGPGLAGVLVEWLTAPFAILLDAASFVVSGIVTWSMRHVEPVPEPTTDARLGPGVREGLRRVVSSPLLRPLVLCAGVHNICSTMIVTVFVLYLTRDLAVTPALIGLVFLGGGVGALCGSVVSNRVSSRLGVGPTLIAAQLVTGFARLLVPLAVGSLPLVLTLLFLSELVLGMARACFNINQISLRQAAAPTEYLGRVNATIGFLYWGFAPLGALAGGYLGDLIGVRPTLFLAATGVLLATVLAWPLRSLRELGSPSS